MRNFIAVLCTSVFLIVLPTAVHANENPEIQKEEKAKKGLVGGLLQQVKGTVDKTVKSTGELVEETVKFTGDTVDRTVNFTTETVNTVADPKQKKPVKTVVENTTNFVGETVEKTVPVVEQTTKTVQTVTNETVKVTKPLPKVPVVTPVVEQTTQTVEKVTEQVKKTVDDTVGTVTETVSKPLMKKPVEGTPPVAEEKPNQGSSQTSPTEKPDQPNVTEQPSEDRYPTAGENHAGTPEATVPSEGERPEAKPEVDIQGESPVKESVKEDTTVSKGHAVNKESEEINSASAQGAKPIEDQFTMERKGKRTKTPSTDSKSLETMSSQAFPLKPSTRSSWMSDVQLVTGTSSIHLSTSSTSTGTSGFGAILADDWLMNAEIVSQKWYLEDILGILQCSHAPPGQPPQSTPFLYVI
ncbi:hypothetical protein [Sporosarcina gallistercoris]|uniref:hypothetical protein n=1 Tax=Sporosarcina gallistercoris TaxID=2762245 RepID=UPI001782FF48|nr:hypothetical protein [Sporosarcina gallistercoris]